MSFRNEFAVVNPNEVGIESLVEENPSHSIRKVGPEEAMANGKGSFVEDGTATKVGSGITDKTALFHGEIPLVPNRSSRGESRALGVYE